MDAETITAVASLIASLTATAAYLESRRNRRGLNRVEHEVTTLNGLTMANLADATETRRIEQVADDERTDRDRRHLRDIPPEVPPGG